MNQANIPGLASSFADARRDIKRANAVQPNLWSHAAEIRSRAALCLDDNILPAAKDLLERC